MSLVYMQAVHGRLSTYERLVNSQNFFSPYLTQEDLSRFGRNFLEMGNYLELILPLYGVRFISINDAFDSDDYLGVTGGLELALRNLINNMYSRDLSTKVRSAFRTRNLRGEYWGGNGFYGYQVHPHNKKRLSLRLQSQKLQGGECKLKTARVYLPCAIQ